ncbi:DUF2851 family protein [Dysgonomonas massiliensis]|uniref:DUF2851 family protein n=1 Tax=Dysgonomonas massiliensis TaxID=2040292 RepID=UPI000C76B01B|nr:DUF2851 family protein [Dysgonomonas massiliensis]
MESILHYVWQNRLFDENLTTADGLSIEVIDVGRLNSDAGPDFFNAKVKIDGKLWAGNVEIHTAASDWERHRHAEDRAYDSTILHIVGRADRKDVTNSQGRQIPQCAITYPDYIDKNYEYLFRSQSDIPCGSFISTLSPIHITSWMQNLLFERLQTKTERIEHLLELFNNSWEDVFYVLLTRNFGFGLNSDSFERLALSLPYAYLRKHGDNLFQIEALLFGQAGLLDEVKQSDEYFSRLKQEYDFFKSKFTLRPLESSIFKTMRSRPSAFPQIRVAQLAALLHFTQGLFSKVINCEDMGRIRLMFHVNASEYWQTHYTFGQVSDKKSKYLGDASLDIILINTVAPILFAYGKSINDDTYCERAMRFLETIKAERNTITRQFAGYGIPMNTAFDSQATIQLKKEYCIPRKCFQCRIGHQLLKKK